MGVDEDAVTTQEDKEESLTTQEEGAVEKDWTEVEEEVVNLWKKSSTQQSRKETGASRLLYANWKRYKVIKYF